MLIVDRVGKKHRNAPRCVVATYVLASSLPKQCIPPVRKYQVGSTPTNATYSPNVSSDTIRLQFLRHPTLRLLWKAMIPTPVATMPSNRWTINPLSKFAQTELLWTQKINFLSLDCFVTHCAPDNWIFSTICDLVTSRSGFVVKFNGVILRCLIYMEVRVWDFV